VYVGDRTNEETRLAHFELSICTKVARMCVRVPSLWPIRGLSLVSAVSAPEDRDHSIERLRINTAASTYFCVCMVPTVVVHELSNRVSDLTFVDVLGDSKLTTMRCH